MDVYGTYYQASCQVTWTEGMWCPHEESKLVCSPRFSTITECCLWLANQPETYAAETEVFIDLWMNGSLQREWSL